MKKLTKKPGQMLCTVNIQRTLISEVARPILPLAAERTVLFTLESVEQDLVEGFIKVLPDARDDFLKNVQISRGSPFRLLFIEVIVKDLVD